MTYGVTLTRRPRHPQRLPPRCPHCRVLVVCLYSFRPDNTGNHLFRDVNGLATAAPGALYPACRVSGRTNPVYVVTRYAEVSPQRPPVRDSGCLHSKPPRSWSVSIRVIPSHGPTRRSGRSFASRCEIVPAAYEHCRFGNSSLHTAEG